MRNLGCTGHVALLILALNAAVCVHGQAECTDKDKRWIFSPCSGISSLQSSIEYFQAGCKPGVTATSAKVRAPVPVKCDKPCGSGEWWDPAKPDVCTTCPAGTMSNSGGRVITDYAEWPEGFTTFCDPEPCQPWQAGPSGTYLWSGNQSAGGSRYSRWNKKYLDDTVKSTLAFMVPVINDKHFGRIIFKYRTESEYHFDGLRIYINGTLVQNVNAPDSWSPFIQSGWHSSWTKRTIELPLGLSEVRMVYTKDSNQNSMYGESVGADAAFIRDLTIEGLQWYAPECTPCVNGKFSSAGAMKCLTCANNQYSNDDTEKQCKDCAAGYWAPPGSAECRKKKPCTKMDYVAVYTDCDRNSHKRDLSWELVSSRCETEGAGATLPTAKKNLACAECQPGFQRDTASWKCVPCPNGLYYDLGEKKCRPCSAGRAAIKQIHYKGFETFGSKIDPKVFKQECQGECAGCAKQPMAGKDADHGSCTVKGGGWTLTPAFTKAGGADHSTVVIRTDLDNGQEFNTSLTYEWDSLADGEIHIQYHFMRMSMAGVAAGDNEGYSGEVELDGKSTVLDKNFVSIEHAGFYSRKVPHGIGKHKLVIRFSQESSHAEEDPIAFMLQDFHVNGDTRGGATACEVCPPGAYCPEATAVPIMCPAGTYNPAEAETAPSSCKACNTHEYSPKKGSKKCQRCDPGSEPDPTQTFCVNTCKFTAHRYMPVTPGGAFDHPHFTFPGEPTAPPTTAPPTTPMPLVFTGTPTGVVIGTYDFDLTPLQDKVFGPIYLDGTDTEGLTMTQADTQNLHRFFVSPCTMVNKAAGSQVCTKNEDTYSCQRVNVNQTYAAGDRAIYEYTHPNLRVSFLGGDMCSHGGMARSTNITFMCDPEAPLPGVLSYRGEFPHCHYNFVLHSPVGCPLCKESSYKKNVGQCTDTNKRKVVYWKIDPNDKCQGGWTPPANADEVCDYCQKSYYQETWDDCLFGKQHRIMVLKAKHEGCVGDDKVKFGNVSRSCSTVNVRVGANGFTLFFAVLIPVLLFLIIFGICFFCKFSTLQNKYARLQGAGNTPGGAEELGDVNGMDTAEEVRERREKAAANVVGFDGRNGNGKTEDDLERGNEPAVSSDP